MLKRKTEVDRYQAIVAFSAMDQAAGLSGQLDEAFGKDCWTFTTYQNVADALEAGARSEEDGVGYFVVGVQDDDDATLRIANEQITAASELGRKVILLAEALNPASLHGLMRAGAGDFAPLPLPAGALNDCVARLSLGGAVISHGGARRGLVFPVYGAAGGVGASTLVINLAWETARAVEKSGRRVALMDFNFQYGSVATYLDLPRREAIYELLSDTSTIDEEGFSQALTNYANKMAVLTAPMDALPLDIIGPDDVRSMINLARVNYDFIFIDLPQTLAHWSDLVLTEAEVFYAVMESDMRSAQNMLRFIRAVKAEDLPIEKIAVCLNRAPSFTDLSGKTRSRRLEESLGVEFAHRLPDGGKAVAQACDQGSPLASGAKGNALRKEIRKMAQGIIKAVDAAKSEKAS